MQRSVAFVDGVRADGTDFGELREIEYPVYPRSLWSERMRKARLDYDLSLGDAARALGIGVADYSDIERGAKRIAGDDEYYRALAVLEAARRE
jgi:hypothetical protein